MPPQRRRILHGLSLDKIAAVDAPCQEPALAVMIKRRSYTENERTDMAAAGEALPDGSFPIKNATDLGNAIHDYGRASDKPKAKTHIIGRAKALDSIEALPEEWGVSKSVAASAELAKVDMPVARGFAEILAQNEAQEEAWEAESAMWPLFDALRQSLGTIATDPALADTDRLARATDSVNQFVSALKTEWPDVADAVDKIAKASPNAGNMDPFIKAGLAGAKEAPMPELNKVANADAAKALIEGDPILKAHVDALIDKAVEIEVEKAKPAFLADDMEADGKPTKKGLEFIEKHRPAADDEILKVGEQTIKKSIVGADNFAVFKAQQTQISDEIEKRVVAEMEKKAEAEYPSLVGTSTEKGLILKHLASAPEPVRKSAEAILAAAEKATKGAFETRGAGGGEQPNVQFAKAKQDFASKVDEIRKRDNCSRTDALEKAERENPDLFKAMQDADGETAAAA